MDTKTSDDDHRPRLGQESQLPEHIAAFITWAAERDVLTIGLSLVRLIPNPTRPRLLGGLLRFISYRDTLELLKNWAPESSVLRQLTLLSEQLVDFPDIELPLTSQPMHRQFTGELDFNYLAVHFSTRRAPGLTSRDQLKITCFRVWLLLKALDLLAAGHQADQSLHLLCTQLRMALDDKDSGKKLSWFLSTIEPALSLQGFQGSLRLEIAKERREATGADVDRIRAIDALLDNRPRPRRGWVPVLLNLPPSPNGLKELSSISTAWFSLDPEEGNSLLFQETEEEKEFRIQEVSIDPELTPPQAAREARGIALQTQEDQQYLLYTWNRLRADETALLRTNIKLALAAPDPRKKLLVAICALAMCTRRSMKTIETLKLSSNTDEDWQLDLKEGYALPSHPSVWLLAICLLQTNISSVVPLEKGSET